MAGPKPDTKLAKNTTLAQATKSASTGPLHATAPNKPMVDTAVPGQIMNGKAKRAVKKAKAKAEKVDKLEKAEKELKVEKVRDVKEVKGDNKKKSVTKRKDSKCKDDGVQMADEAMKKEDMDVDVEKLNGAVDEEEVGDDDAEERSAPLESADNVDDADTPVATEKQVSTVVRDTVTATSDNAHAEVGIVFTAHNEEQVETDEETNVVAIEQADTKDTGARMIDEDCKRTSHALCIAATDNEHEEKTHGSAIDVPSSPQVSISHEVPTPKEEPVRFCNRIYPGGEIFVYPNGDRNPSDVPEFVRYADKGHEYASGLSEVTVDQADREASSHEQIVALACEPFIKTTQGSIVTYVLANGTKLDYQFGDAARSSAATITAALVDQACEKNDRIVNAVRAPKSKPRQRSRSTSPLRGRPSLMEDHEVVKHFELREPPRNKEESTVDVGLQEHETCLKEETVINEESSSVAEEEVLKAAADDSVLKEEAVKVQGPPANSQALRTSGQNPTEPSIVSLDPAIISCGKPLIESKESQEEIKLAGATGAGQEPTSPSIRSLDPAIISCGKTVISALESEENKANGNADAGHKRNFSFTIRRYLGDETDEKLAVDNNIDDPAIISCGKVLTADQTSEVKGSSEKSASQKAPSASETKTPPTASSDLNALINEQLRACIPQLHSEKLCAPKIDTPSTVGLDLNVFANQQLRASIEQTASEKLQAVLQQAQQNSGRQNIVRRPRKFCNHCHKPGHDEITCFRLHPELRATVNKEARTSNSNRNISVILTPFERQHAQQAVLANSSAHSRHVSDSTFSQSYGSGSDKAATATNTPDTVLSGRTTPVDSGLNWQQKQMQQDQRRGRGRRGGRRNDRAGAKQ